MLISTLKDGLKENFTDKVKNAWLKVFDVVQIQMKVGMKQAASPQIISNDSNEINHTNNSPSMNNDNNMNDHSNGKLVNEIEQINLQTAN